MIALLRWLFSTLGMKVVATGQTATATRGAAPRQELCVCGQELCVCVRRWHGVVGRTRCSVQPQPGRATVRTSVG